MRHFFNDLPHFFMHIIQNIKRGFLEVKNKKRVKNNCFVLSLRIF